MKTGEKRQISEEAQDFSRPLGFVSNIRNICSFWKQDTKIQLTQQILCIALLVKHVHCIFCNKELLTFKLYVVICREWVPLKSQ